MFDSVNISEFIKYNYCPEALINVVNQFSDKQKADMYTNATKILQEYRDKSTKKPKKSKSAIPLKQDDIPIFDKYINSFIEQYTILYRIQSGKKTVVPEIDMTCALFEYLVLKYSVTH